MTIQTTHNDSNNRANIELMRRLRSIWLGRRDSNPRMPVPKTGALPLGHAPLQQIDFSLVIVCTQMCFFSSVRQINNILLK
jgi:hypothetical protein